MQQRGPRSPEYARVLERYLARLVQMKQIPPALGVLRREIDRNPDDPGLYERFATFLDQNRLGAQQEEIYRLAISRFSDKSWYDKLARFYLREKRNSEFEKLTRDAVASFKGSDLEQYFSHVVGGSPVLYLRLNLYANQRFPHNPAFVRNLLSAYHSTPTYDEAAWEALIRQHWFEDPNLRNRFFSFLSSKGKLDQELNAIRQIAPDAASWEKNPAAANFMAYANLWRSHFEESAPLSEVAGRAVSGGVAKSRTRLRQSFVRSRTSNLPTPRSPPRSRTICCKSIPAIRKPSPASATSTPIVSCSRKPLRTGSAFREWLPAGRMAISKRPRSTGTTSTSTMRSAC